MEYTINYKPTPKARLFHADTHRYTLIGGSKGCGKTVMLCWEAVILSLEFDHNRGFMGRKRGSDFRNTTLKTFYDQIPSNIYEVKDRESRIVFINGSEILLGGLDDEKEIVKFNSMELGFFAIDQAEEISYEDFAALSGTLRYQWNGKKPRYRGMLSCNPRNGWLKDKFLLNPEPDYKFIQMLPIDNPYLPPDYIPHLTEVLKHRPKLLKAYVYGSWDDLDDADIIIPYQEVVKCVNKEVSNLGKPKIIISCDVARMGEDESVIYVTKNLKVIDELMLETSDTMTLVGHLALIHKKYNSDGIVVDATGVGGGVYDRLMELGLPVIAFNSSERASEPDKFKNMKAEAWFMAADKFHRGEVSIPDDDVLKGQLSGVKYRPYEDKIEIETKKETKKRLGKSPDRADSLVMNIWAYNIVHSFKPEDYEDEYRRANRFIPTRTGYG